MTLPVHRGAFLTMSTTVEIVGVGVTEADVAEAVASGRRLSAIWEDRFSRFRPDSLLSRLNAAEGAAVPVDGVFLELLDRARTGVMSTGGRFNPAILSALEAAGYRQSIERVRAEPPNAIVPVLPIDTVDWNFVEIDHARGEVRLPPGMRIDLGGIAKGAFVDRLAAMLADWPGGVIDAGGDLRVWGIPPQGERWRVGIEDPLAAESDLLVAEVSSPGGIGSATSGTHRRQWRVGGQTANHLIYPRTGRPVDAVIAATAFAPSVTTAEIAAKALIVAAGENRERDLFGAQIAVVIRDDGSIEVMNEDPSNGRSIAFTPAASGAA